MWRCTVCNWIYDEAVEETPFKDLPESYTCPVCGAPKSAFEALAATSSTDSESTPSVADVLVDALVDVGVTRIYGIPGDSNLPLIEAIRANDSIELVTTRHEHAAAFMACGHAKLTGELGVCVSIAGPGATNLITGLMDAVGDRAPVLALVGQVPEIYLGSEAFQEIDQIELFKSFAAFAETLGRASQLPRLFGLAVKSAFARQGVSVLSLPTNVLTEPAVTERWDRPKRLFRAAMVPSETDLQAAARLINDAEHPAVFAGWGTRRSARQVQELAEILKAPIATTSRAKGVVPDKSPLALGVLGSLGNPYAPAVLSKADLLIILGTGFRQSNLLPDIPILQVDLDPVRLGRNFSVELGLVGEVSRTLSALVPLLEKRTKVSARIKDSLERARDKWEADREEDRFQDGSPIHPGFLVAGLRRHVKPNAIVAVDVGDHTYWYYRRFQSEDEFTLMSASMASMGFALPAAVASQFECPEHQVVCVTGDGGFAMVMGDFTTAVKHHLPIKVIVFNDSRLKNIKKEQNRDGYPEYGITLLNPDFAVFAESTGALGVRVDSGKDLDDAMSKVFSHDGPALLDVVLDPEAMLPGVKNVMPL